MTEEDKKFLKLITNTDGKVIPFPNLNGKCEICGKINDHLHYKFDEKLNKNVVIKHRSEL